MEESVKKAKKFDAGKFWEWFWLSFFGLFFLGGVTFGILGIVCNNAPRVLEDPLYLSQKSFVSWLNWPFLGLVDYRVFGAILLLIGSIGILIDLYVTANRAEKKALVQSRREERLKALMADESLLLKKAVASEAPKDGEPSSHKEES